MHRTATSTFRWRQALFACVALALPGVGQAQETTSPPDIMPPWELTTRDKGDPDWKPLPMIRAAAEQYRGTQYWGPYAQVLAHAEAGVGNHGAALAAWDLPYPPRGPEGDLPEGLEAHDAVQYLAAKAATERVIMINERHHAASDRLLTLELLSPLWDKGYRYFAAEAFDARDTQLNERTYPTGDSGVYVKDPVFAAVVREALRLGYTLVPYESVHGEGDNASMTPQQRRDFGQARNLARATVDQDPEARVLVHAGYSHVIEIASERWYPMALYFRERTGIDPLTVDQTRLSERSTPDHEHPMYRAAVAAGHLEDGPVVFTEVDGSTWSPTSFGVDVQVFTPRTRLQHDRPTWMQLGGRRQLYAMEAQECVDQWCLLEARLANEPLEAIPLDRVELDGSARAWVFVPRDEKIIIRVLDFDGNQLRVTSPQTMRAVR